MGKPKVTSPKESDEGSLRGLFQTIIQGRIKTIADMESLAKDLGVSASLVKKMVYHGEGGLDVWGKAFQKLFSLNEEAFTALKNDLRKRTTVSESDQLWFSIRDDLKATEDDMYYLAACAKEAFRIKLELETAKKKKRSK